MLGGRLRSGDKLMLSGRNLHDLGLMNGTVLRLLGVREDLVTVAAEGVMVELPEEDAGALRLAYACSVHKGRASSCRSRCSWPTRPRARSSCGARCSTRR